MTTLIQLLMLAAIASFIVDVERGRGKVAPGGWQKPDRRIVAMVLRQL